MPVEQFGWSETPRKQDCAGRNLWPRLVARYGTEAPAVAALGEEPVVDGQPETVGELRFAVRAEGARTVSDLLDRRTRIGLVAAEREAAVPVAERVLAEER